MTLSEKGKDFKGNKLTEHNLNADVLVKYGRKYYFTGNRYHTSVELYTSVFYGTVDMSKIKIVKP